MHSRFRSNGVSLTALAALLALLVLPGSLLALPKPGAPGRGFRLMAHAIGAMTVNRVLCGLSATGEVCVDSTGSSTIGGGFWPKGSPQQYVFNSGLQAAGSIDSLAPFAWAGDTTGAFFFDPKGTTQHGEQVEPIWNTGDPADKAAWPAAANVPNGAALGGDAQGDLFNVNLQGKKNASQADIWSLAWDGNPGQNAGRPHPLGIAVETRGMGWNYPTFNNDIIYFIYTFYNITSSDVADYASVRPELRQELADLGARFQQLNNAAFGITIPTHGYAIQNFYANFSADMDVSGSASGTNYSSVNLPFSLGYVYETNFKPTDNGYVLPPDISGGNFLNGYGFVGVKYLKSPINPATGKELGIRLFSNTVNGGLFNDPPNVQALFRYVSGTVDPAKGDGNCNYSPIIDHICYVKNDAPADMRFFQSSGPQTLAPGGFGSIVVAYEFASAVKVGSCPVSNCPTVLPGDPRRLSNAALMAAGANTIDSMTGYLGYADTHDANGNPGGDGVVQQDEFKTVKGSLLAKALVAQTVFDNKFLLPSAPDSPDFFLIPGDNQVTVVWRKSATETTGDTFYPAAHLPGTPANPNLIYDPNYRQFDVEGYRVYRGRVDNPSTLTLLAQFDYAGTTMKDYLGILNPVASCAPELGLNTNAGCGRVYTIPSAGNPYLVSATYDIVSPFIQLRSGDRALLANGTAIITSADTTVTGAGSLVGTTPFPPLTDNGVPFTYTDTKAKNNLRYFYAVTAFDVNSYQSGPTSLESARVTKAVTPVHAASNYSSTGGVTTVAHFGRGVNMDSVIPNDPTIDPTTGEFSGPARPATGASIGFVGAFLSKVVSTSGALSYDLVGMTPGSAYDGIAAHYFIHIGGAPDTLDISVVQNFDNTPVGVNGSFAGAPLDNALASRYGGSSVYTLQGQYALDIEGTYLNGGFGRGCINSGGHKGGSCGYDGPRWFAGANESFPNPTQGNKPNGAGPDTTSITNAGSLPGVATIFEGRSYQTRPNTFRTVEGVLSSISTAADYKVYWGAAAGTVDSVVDITHNVIVPFDTTFKQGYTWGFLTQAATAGAGSGDTRPGVLTLGDLGCVNPLHSFAAPNGNLGCAAGTHYNFVNTATLGPVAFGKSPASDIALPPRPNPGFGMYLAGHFFLFEMNPATPAPSATVWTLRSYVGAIDGGGAGCATCQAGNFGAYTFTPSPSPLTAVGSGLAAKYTVSNVVSTPTTAMLAQVHTVPDPYYITNGFERSSTGKVIKFVNLPDKAIVRIYSTSGVLVRVLEHTSNTFDGSLDWDVRNRNNQIVASGVYFYAIEAGDARRVGRMTIVNFAQ